MFGRADIRWQATIETYQQGHYEYLGNRFKGATFIKTLQVNVVNKIEYGSGLVYPIEYRQALLYGPPPKIPPKECME